MIKNSICILIILFLSHSVFAQDLSPSEKCLTNHPSEDRYASYSPDGEWITFESNRAGNWGIFLMDWQGQNLQKLTNSSADNRRPTWHPNGKKILFESNRNGAQELFTITIKNKKEKKLDTDIKQGELIFATYSPDGRQIAASLKESDDKSNIVLLNKKGHLIRNLSSNNYRNYYPKWSNDGKEIVYFSRKDTENQDDEIYRLAIDTGESIRLTTWHKHNFCPSWSGDNQQIAYVTSMEDTRPEIYIMDADGQHEKRLTNNNDGETLPNWHPTENKLLITAYRDGNYEICELKW